MQVCTCVHACSWEGRELAKAVPNIPPTFLAYSDSPFVQLGGSSPKPFKPYCTWTVGEAIGVACTCVLLLLLGGVDNDKEGGGEALIGDDPVVDDCEEDNEDEERAEENADERDLPARCTHT